MIFFGEVSSSRKCPFSLTGCFLLFGGTCLPLFLPCPLLSTVPDVVLGLRLACESGKTYEVPKQSASAGAFGSACVLRTDISSTKSSSI